MQPAARRRRPIGPVVVWLLTFVTILVTTFGAADVAPASDIGAPASNIGATATCCAPAVRVAPPEAGDDRIAIVGDSITLGVTSPAVLGADTLPARLDAAGKDVFADARKGRTIDEGTAVIEARRDVIERADVVLLGLGTNNIWGNTGRSQADAEGAIAGSTEAVLVINPYARVMWIELAVEVVPTRTTRFNDALAAMDARFESIEVCEWRTLVLANPNWFASDRIHLTGTGYGALRDVLADCLLR